jgi:hypothetical protein
MKSTATREVRHRSVTSSKVSGVTSLLVPVLYVCNRRTLLNRRTSVITHLNSCLAHNNTTPLLVSIVSCYLIVNTEFYSSIKVFTDV